MKLSPPPTTDSFSIVLGGFRGGRFTFTNATLDDMALFAFGLPSKDLLVGLDWADSVRFDVQAIAPLDTQQPQLRRMVRGLLEERLKLVSRSDQRTLRYVALVAPGGPTKLKEATTIPAPVAQLRGRINDMRMPMGRLALLLSRFEQMAVVDRTGLEGLYEVKLEWAPDAGGPLAPGADPPADLPSLYAAVREQLGLRLEGRRGPVDVVVIQSASREPTAN